MTPTFKGEVFYFYPVHALKEIHTSQLRYGVIVPKVKVAGPLQKDLILLFRNQKEVRQNDQKEYLLVVKYILLVN